MCWSQAFDVSASKVETGWSQASAVKESEREREEKKESVVFVSNYVVCGCVR